MRCPERQGHSIAFLSVSWLPPPPTSPGTSALRIILTYLWRHRRLPRLRSPQLLTEWIQHRKLYERDLRLPELADKVLVKNFVAQRLGDGYVTPTLWRGRALPTEPAWPYPYVVKSRHGCGQFAVVRDRSSHLKAVRASRRWMRAAYGAWLDEWLYCHIERGLLVEPFIGQNRELPVDYKLFVFGGKVEFIQVHLGRGTGQHRWIVFDRTWCRVSQLTDDPDPKPPASVLDMVAGAERLGGAFPFVRVDFYEVCGRARFGEMTFYPGSGLEPVLPPELDYRMGQMWKVAQYDKEMERDFDEAA